MVDLSKLSNEELMAMAAQREQSRRSVSSMTDDELRAAAYVQPKPPPGVTIHGASGDVYVDSKGQQKPATAAETEARYMRERDGVGSDVRDSVLRGVPFVGEFMPRARAAMQGGDYAQNLSREQARSKTFDSDYPIASLGGKAMGAIGGTVAALPLMAQSGAVGGVANTLFGGGASTAMGAMARGGVAGALQGGAQGAGQSRDLTDYGDVAGNAAKDAAFGGLLGAAIPGAISLGSAATQRVRGIGGDALSSIPRPAARWAERQFSDPAKLAQMRQGIDDLGPNAMLADVSPEMASVARGAAARPGTRDMIINALNSRDAGKNARIGSAVDANFGPATVPSQIEAGIREGQEALGPAYGDALSGAGRVNTQPIADTLDASAVNLRGPAQRAVNQVRGYLDIPGAPGNLDPNPSALFQTRQAIDGLMATEQNPQVIRQLTMARQSVDQEIANAVPGIKNVDANFQELARQREALQRGGQVLDSGKTAVRPNELAQEITQAANPAGTLVGPSAVPLRMREGARAEIDRIIGTNANDVAKLNQVLKSEGDWNRDKLRLLFGQDKADEVFKVLDAERVMEATRNRVVGNSETQATKGFFEFIDNASRPTRIDPNMSLFGAMVAAGKKGVDRLSGNRAEGQAEFFAQALSRLPVAQKAEADALIQALMTRAQRNQQSGAVNRVSGAVGPNARLIEMLMGPDSGFGSDQIDRRR